MARTQQKRDVKRVQLDMPPKSYQRLQHLVDVTEASSSAEVIKNALKLYELLVNEAEEGSEFQIRRDGETVIVPILS